MAKTIIDERYQIWTSVGVAYYMWTHYLVTYDDVIRNGNQVTLKNVCMKAWWEAGTTNYFYYYGTISYGFELIINNNVVASVSRTHPAGSRYQEGTVLAEQCGIDVHFTADPGTTTIPVRIRGTGGVSGDESSGNVTFYIPPAIDPPGPTSGRISCSIGSGTASATEATVSFSGVNFNCPSGNSCNNKQTLTISANSSYSPAIYSGSANSYTARGLQPNTKYYARGVVSNGQYSSTSTCSFTTTASSSVFGYQYKTDQVSNLSMNVDKGGNACATTTKVYVRERGTSSWQQVYSTSDYGIQSFQLRNIIQRGKKYEAKSESTNCAGTYVSPIYQFEPPAADSIIGNITSLDSELESASAGQSVTVNYCYTVTSAMLEPVSETNPITVSIQYRIKGQGEWQDTDAITITTNTFSTCGSLPHLACSSEYEFRLLMQSRSVKVYSAIRTLVTATCADVNSCTCETFEYMTELICQTFNRIKTGMKDIYANCDTKEFCDPYSKNPTWTSILSRLTRFFQAVACVLCSMDVLQFSDGEDDEVYTATTPGEPGAWERLAYDAEEGNGRLLSSDGAKKAIDFFIASVWHPIGIYDYFSWDETELPEEAENPAKNATLVMGKKWYKYDGKDWVVQGNVEGLDAFATILIKNGTHYANNEFYWFGEEWNLLDFTTGPAGKRVEFLEENEPYVTKSIEGDKPYNIIVENIEASNQQIYNDIQFKNRKTVVLLTDGVFVTNPFILDTDLLDGGKELI